MKTHNVISFYKKKYKKMHNSVEQFFKNWAENREGWTNKSDLVYNILNVPFVLLNYCRFTKNVQYKLKLVQISNKNILQ